MLPEDTWVSLVENQFQGEHKVINASISGETSKGGLIRLPALLVTHQPDILIIELGANDGLRGYPINQMANNLQAMIDMAKAESIEVILLGIRLPPNFGKRYTEPFFNKFAELADANNILYLPFLLDGVAQYTNLMQADGLHPTKEAQSIIFDNVKPYIHKTLNN